MNKVLRLCLTVMLIISISNAIFAASAGAPGDDVDIDMALIYEVQENNIEIAKSLLDSGADVNVKIDGKVPLSYAIENNNLDMVKLLIEYGADSVMAPGLSFVSEVGDHLNDEPRGDEFYDEPRGDEFYDEPRDTLSLGYP